MNKKVFLLLLFLVIVTAGGYWLWEDQEKTLDDTRLELYGNVDIREVRIAFDGNGHIDEIHVQEGDKVEQGQILAHLKTSTPAGLRGRGRSGCCGPTAGPGEIGGRQSTRGNQEGPSRG